MPRIFKTLDDAQPVKTNGTAHLGAGSFSKVNLVCHKSNPSKWYAMKEISKITEQERKLIFQEISLHMSLDHQNIIKFEDYLETQDKVYIFLEYAKEGDLFGHITRKNPNEQQLLKFFYQTCVAIEYIHSKNIMHRDLKPENILLDADLNVKLCDFGWSAEYREEVNRETLCGTYEYMAPEVFFRNKQTKKTDIWALGILLYELYHGYAPFRGTRMDSVMQAIMQNTIAFKKNLAPEVKDLILKILVFDPKKRFSIADILTHDLIVNYVKDKDDKIPEKENLELKTRYANTDTKNFKKRPDLFFNSFYSRTIDNDKTPSNHFISQTPNPSPQTPLNFQFSKPNDLSLFLKKKPKTQDYGNMKHYASMDRLITEPKSLTSRYNYQPGQTPLSTPVSNLYTQRLVGVNHSFSNSISGNSKFMTQRTANNRTELYSYTSKPETRDFRTGNIYSNVGQNVKYNFTKKASGANLSFTNYFNKI